MMEAIALAIYSATLITVAWHIGDTRGYSRGLDHAAQMIFGIPVVWP